MSGDGMKYYPDPIAAFQDGCLMDLRLRFAMKLLEGGAIGGHATHDGMAKIAGSALELAGELFKQAEVNGWIQPLSESGELTHDMKRHLERAVKSQLYQQKVAQREQAGEVRTVLNG